MDRKILYGKVPANAYACSTHFSEKDFHTPRK